MKYVCFGIKEIRKEKFDEIKNSQKPNKPDGGLWASPYINNNKYICDWERWCLQNGFFDGLSENYIIFELKNNCKIYKIDGMDEFKKLINKYGQHDFFEKLGFQHEHKTFITPDFENIKNYYDGLLLTKKGLKELHLPLDYRDFKYNLYGWDCETLLLFDIKYISKYKSFKYELERKINEHE